MQCFHINSRLHVAGRKIERRILPISSSSSLDAPQLDHYALLGDGIYELFIRNRFFTPPKSLTNYHQACQGHSSAERQAVVLDALSARGILTAEESKLVEIVMASSRNFRQRFSSEEKQSHYRKATALESLLGFLHQTQPERLEAILNCCGEVVDDYSSSSESRSLLRSILSASALDKDAGMVPESSSSD
jgi:ribonuclease-3 family protein